MIEFFLIKLFSKMTIFILPIHVFDMKKLSFIAVVRIVKKGVATTPSQMS